MKINLLFPNNIPTKQNINKSEKIENKLNLQYARLYKYIYSFLIHMFNNLGKIFYAIILSQTGIIEYI